MPLTPITAPTPTTPQPWYAVTEVRIIQNDGTYRVAWGIMSEQTQEFLLSEIADKLWVAKSRNCAMNHVRYLNGWTSEFPECDCQPDEIPEYDYDTDTE